MKSKKGKLIMAAAELVVAALLLTMCVYSYAWFSTNRTVSAGGMNISVQGYSGVTVDSFQVYKRDGSLDAARKVSDNLNPVSVEMTEYDTVFTDRNVNTPVIVRVLLTGVDGTQAVRVTLDCPSDHWKTENDILSNYMSNLIRVNCSLLPALDAYNPDTQPDDIYTGAISALSSGAQRYASVTRTVTQGVVSYSNDAKITQISFTIGTDAIASALADTYLNTGELAVYFELDYAAELVDAYITQHGIDVTSTGSVVNDMIDFTYDVGSFTFEYIS